MSLWCLTTLVVVVFVRGDDAARPPRGGARSSSSVAALNDLWVAAVENRETATELSSAVYGAARQAEIAAKTAALIALDGTPAPAPLEARADFDDGSFVTVRANGTYVVEARPPQPPPRDAAASIMDLEYGRELCDMPGMDSTRRAPSAEERYVDVVKRRALGYDGRGRWDIWYERVATGGAARWHLADPTVLSFAHLGSLNLLEVAIKDLVRSVPGDVAECGVFRGGTALVAAAALEAYDHGSRLVWALDTFDGVPDTDEHTKAWPERSYAAPEDDVRRNFGTVGLERRLRTVRGQFGHLVDSNASLPARLALLRVDADTYQGTLDALRLLYDAVSPRGVVIVDDHHLGGCRRAVRDFRAERNITAPLLPAPIDYVLGCPLDHRRTRWLAEDLLFFSSSKQQQQQQQQRAAQSSSPRRRILTEPMYVAQNVYWRKKN
ncbi:hypothetical protein CTAYLR_002213 [Chrysophaeum taylorii]|uniref:Macrocin O-methyltransferase n=1 Tax=Chrysophaeum taylorii TaxID=2483200 RepID=A0AAD7UPU9_9STRA|nr:hypothetical protein CTAYLR_002213 [Chrysophaeum taylorii]